MKVRFDQIRDTINFPLFYPLFFSLIIFCIFLPHILGGYTCAAITMEGVSQWHPFWTFAKRQVGEGYFPLWTPHSLGGWNLPAFSHSAVFYPLALSFYIFSYADAFTQTVPFHMLIAYFLMYRFLRGAKIEPFSASLGSALWATGGLLLAYADFLPLLWTITWTPLFFDSAKRWMTEGRIVNWILFIIAASLQFLGGNVEGFIYELTALIFLLLLLGHIDKIVLLRALFLFLGLFAVALLVSISLLPALELMPRSVRSIGLSYAYFAERGFPFKYWVGFLLPVNLLGKSMEGEKILLPSYLGILTFIFFFYGLFFTRAEIKIVAKKLAGLALFIYLFTNRDLPFIGAITYHLPVFNKMREPVYGLFVPQFLLVTVAVMGIDSFFRATGQGASNSDKKRNYVLLFLSFLFLLGVILTGIRISTHYTWLKEEQYLLLFVAFFIAFLLILSSVLTAQMSLLFKIAFITFFLCDNFATAFTYFPKHKADFLAPDDDYKNFFNGKPPYERHIITDKYGPRTASLPPNAGMLINSQTLEGWEGIPDLRIIKFLSLIDERVIDFENEKLNKIRHHFTFRDGKFLEPSSLPYLDLAGIKFIVSRGIPLKFASPMSLVDMKDGFQISNKGAVVFSKTQIDHTFYKAIEINSPVVFSTNLHLFEGDFLRFQLCGGKTGEGIFEITLLLDGSQISIFSSSLTGISSCPTKAASIDLNNWRGKSVELRFEFKDPEGAKAEKIYLLEPEIVNETKRFQRVLHKSVDIYENPLAFPRAFLVHDFVFSRNIKESFKWLKEHPDQLALIAPIETYQVNLLSNVSRAMQALRIQKERVSITEYKPEVVTIDVDTEAPALLILTDLYYPGWRVLIDGEEEKILPAYSAFRAVSIKSAGKTRIVFKYEPYSFRIGLWATIASILGLVFAIAYLKSLQINEDNR